MKKLIFLIVFGCFLSFFLQSCVKGCTCENPDTNKITDIEISPFESCSDYSNKTLGVCS